MASFVFVFFFWICSYLSSIHEKVNCIAIFWTGRPHSLGSCHLGTISQTSLRLLWEALFFLGIPIEIAKKLDHSAVAIQDSLLNRRYFCFVLIQFSETQQSTCRQQSVQFSELDFE